jgi:hypothetical protein
MITLWISLLVAALATPVTAGSACMDNVSNQCATGIEYPHPDWNGTAAAQQIFVSSPAECCAACTARWSQNGGFCEQWTSWRSNDSSKGEGAQLVCDMYRKKTDMRKDTYHQSCVSGLGAPTKAPTPHPSQPPAAPPKGALNVLFIGVDDLRPQRKSFSIGGNLFAHIDALQLVSTVPTKR